MNNWLKWRETIIISFSKLLAYRSNFILTVLGPAFVAFFIKYHLWSAIYQGHPDQDINGYSLPQMINYHVWALVVALVAQGHTALDLAVEIRYGKISSYLIYPFNFWEFHTASFIAFEVMQVGVALTSLGILSAIGIIGFPTFSMLVFGFCYCIMISLLWFTLQFLMGILAFWLDETWMIRVLLAIVVNFFSGFILPLEFFPPLLVSLLEYTPFPFMTYYPIKFFMGETIPWAKAILTVGTWTVVIAMVNTLIWRKGIRMYTAAGM